MKYFFILGRNPVLSRAEIFSYLESRGVNFDEMIFKENFLVLDLQQEFEFNIQDFGGVLKLGKIDFFGSEKEFNDYLERNELVESDKFSYAIFGNFGEDELKRKFKSEKRKAMLRYGRKQIKFQGDEIGGLPNSDFYFFGYSDDKVYFGIIKQEFEDSGVKKRDMNKPHRREDLAISPRLSRILINLSGVKKGEKLFDCFCGVGGVLQEALIRDFDVIGVDIDKKAIGQARENLAWMKKNFDFNAKYDLIAGDSSKISKKEIGEIGGVAGEAALGVVLRRRLTKEEAKEFIENFENVIIPVLKNLKKIKSENTKIAMTFPVAGEFHTDISGISKKTGLRIFDKFEGFGVKFPILESRRKQYVSRDFVVFY